METASRAHWWVAGAILAVGIPFAAGRCDDGGGVGPGDTEDTLDECTNGIDDDHDGRTDCDDIGCLSLIICQGADADADVDAEVDDDADADDDGAEEEAPDPCASYPCEQGTALGEVIADLSFRPANAAAEALEDEDDHMLYLHKLYRTSVTFGGELTGLMMFVCAGWSTSCTAEADQIEALYEEVHGDGIEFLAIIAEGNTPGEPADSIYAGAYAARHGWTFPTVHGDLDDAYWEPGAEAGSVPFHLFVDLRRMKLYGRYAAAPGMKIPRQVLGELATVPLWNAGGGRTVSFDCAPGAGTEVEPNGRDDPLERGTTLPFSMSGATCAPIVADGIRVDEDIVDLGVLAAGTVVGVRATRPDGSDAYPFFQLERMLSGTTVEWVSYGPGVAGGSLAARQWVIDTDGTYHLVVFDGRAVASRYWGEGIPVPAADECCEGGAGYTYDLRVTSFTLSPTDVALEPATPPTPVPGALTGGDLDVRPLAVVGGTTYAIRMTAADAETLDPYLTLWDPAGGQVLAFNDDAADATGTHDSLVSWAATAGGTIWVVAGYRAAWFRAGPPGYAITVE